MGNVLDIKSFVSKLFDLKGREVDAITFVRDYVQLSLEGNILNAYVWPVIDDGETLLHEGTTGYRERMCNLIGKQVEDLYYETPDVTIHFGHLSLKLILESADGGEVASLRDSSGGYSAV